MRHRAMLVVAALVAGLALANCASTTEASSEEECSEVTSGDSTWGESRCESEGGAWVCETTGEGCRQCNCVSPEDARYH